MIQIAPSMLSADFLHLEQDVEMVNKYADIFHLDVMDGVFVTNITFGLPVIANLRPKTNIIFDVHLMITEPQRYIDDFLRSPGGMPSSADLGIAYELLNYRYNNNLITIISSEYTVEKIYEFDSAIAGRITEMCGEYILAVHYDKAKNMRDSINKLRNLQIQAKKQRNDLKNQNKPFT